MIRWMLAFGLFVASAAVSPIATAQQWILCPNCTTEAGFENAAVQKAQSIGRDGRYLYSVGNPNTKEMMHVEVRISAFDVVPLSSPDEPYYLNAKDDGTGQQNVFLADDTSTSYSTLSSASATSVMPTAAERQSFQSAVRMSSKSLLMVHSKSVDGHESFASSRPEHLGPMLHAYMTANFPGWYASSMSLWSALKRFFGKSVPQGCVIFTNGDSACYTFADYRTGTSVIYIEGTAQNAQGEPLAAGGIGSGGGGGDGSPVPMEPVGDNMLGWKIGGNAYWVCGYVGGKLVHCYIQIM